MSHIYFIHKDDIENYEALNKELEAFEKEENILRSYITAGNSGFESIQALRDKYKVDDILKKYPYRLITIRDSGYSTARENDYIGFYRGFRWDK